MDYMNLTDNEIIARIRDRDDDAMDFMVRKYGQLVKKESRAWFLIGGDADDVTQEGMIGLYKAVRDFVPEKGAAFSTFATLCIRRQIQAAINKSNRQKQQPLNEYISLYAGEDEGDDLLSGLEAHADVSNPEDMMIARERSADFMKKVENSISNMEAQVLDLYLEGLSYADISEKLEITEKAVDNALQRIRTKIRRNS